MHLRGEEKENLIKNRVGVNIGESDTWETSGKYVLNAVTKIHQRKLGFEFSTARARGSVLCVQR